MKKDIGASIAPAMTKKGFTLVELLIVIAIVSVLSVVVILTLNPAELLKQARDSNRISDASTIKSAITIYMGDIVGASLGPTTTCFTTIATTSAGCGSLFTATVNGTTTGATSTKNNVDGTGWIPINFKSISVGTPLGALPVDPTNSNTYYYAYKASTTVWEMNVSAFESTKFANLPNQDGGQSSTVFEVGSSFSL